MNGKGTLIAMDDKEWKLKALKERAKRAGAFNIETRHIDNLKVIKRLNQSADFVLLDVPCSGLGVLKRNFDTKWQDRTIEIQELINIQADILDKYSQMTVKNGTLVYSTCSILPSENQNQIAKFLEKHKDFILEEDRTVLPSEGGDGFYMARLKRLDTTSEENSQNEVNLEKAEQPEVLQENQD